MGKGSISKSEASNSRGKTTSKAATPQVTGRSGRRKRDKKIRGRGVEKTKSRGRGNKSVPQPGMDDHVQTLETDTASMESKSQGQEVKAKQPLSTSEDNVNIPAITSSTTNSYDLLELNKRIHAVEERLSRRILRINDDMLVIHDMFEQYFGVPNMRAAMSKGDHVNEIPEEERAAMESVQEQIRVAENWFRFLG